MKVSFIGMGTMGAPMALNILKAGFSLTVHNRTRSKEEALEKAGAKRAGSPMDAALSAQVVITCLSDTPDVEAVVLGENGIIHGASPGTILVDMSTISPGATRSMGDHLAEKGIKMVDAPVSGGSEGAIKGTLSIMAGGDASDFQTVLPVLKSMGKTIRHIGSLGSGQMTKAINQIIIAGAYWSVAEGMALGIKAGLDMEKVLEALGGGAAASWILTNRSSNMIKNSYPLGFRVKLHRKDLNIALEAAREMGVTLPIGAFIEQMETSLITQGNGDEDISALARIVRKQSGIK
ncbi:MAG: NAD(P)-dependent oxidoreductase [Thermodesulfobacteriota bacterium]